MTSSTFEPGFLGRQHSERREPLIDRALKRIRTERNTKRNLALIGGAAAFALVVAFTFLVYSDLPAPENPANNQGFITEPHYSPGY